ncbi:MAG: hypothetical protein IKW46_05715 [Bacteroidaceae bacterium]|nr:hypothetical protein [Bacteroidaceae bacterium]
MEELYELHFHGSRQEIEKEKQRKRELMSHFPKMLGTLDETKYVLVDDDNKSKLENGFGNKEIDVLPVAVISDESEKTKEQKSVSSFDNNRKTISFDSWKEGSMFLEPKKENRTVAQKLPFDFDGNTAKKENNPFQPGIQFPGLSTVGGNQPRTTTERNDSLALEKDKIENRIDSVWNINDKSNFDLNKNNSSSTSKGTLKVYGKLRTKDYTQQINTLIDNLPVAADILKQLGVGIDIADNLYTTTDKGEYKKRNGIYLDQNNRIVIDSKHVDEYTLISEVFHAAQDQLGMTGTGKSNLEFQEHVIKDLYFKQLERKSNNYDYSKGFSTTDDNNYANFIEDVLNEDGVLDLAYFLSNINSYFDEFQKYYARSGAYQELGIDDFNYNWKVILDLFGIKCK